jgi:hypothetical protein
MFFNISVCHKFLILKFTGGGEILVFPVARVARQNEKVFSKTLLFI